MPMVLKVWVMLAAPPVRSAAPRRVLPFLKVTVPVGFTPVTVAVSVTAWFGRAGLAEGTNWVVVVAAVMVNHVVIEVPPLLLSPA